MLLKDSHLIYYNFLIRKNKVAKMDEISQFCMGQHVSINLDVPRQKQEFFEFNWVVLSWMPIENGFGHHRNGDKKKISFSDCGNRKPRLWWLKVFGFCDFYLFSTSKIFGCLITVIWSTMDQSSSLIWRPNFLVTFFCNWIFLSPLFFFFLEEQ